VDAELKTLARDDGRRISDQRRLDVLGWLCLCMRGLVNELQRHARKRKQRGKHEAKEGQQKNGAQRRPAVPVNATVEHVKPRQAVILQFILLVEYRLKTSMRGDAKKLQVFAHC
jgi:hypothetical protein